MKLLEGVGEIESWVVDRIYEKLHEDIVKETEEDRVVDYYYTEVFANKVEREVVRKAVRIVRNRILDDIRQL